MAEIWKEVDRYVIESLHAPDPAGEAALAANAAAGLDPIDVAPHQGKFLHLLARLCQARRILELGTLGGYSTIWLARSLPPGGQLVTLELEPAHAAVAQQNINRAGFASSVEIRVGPALSSLAQLTGPFDLIFIDADKQTYPQYLEHALRLSRPGTVILCDNVIRRGGIIDPQHSDVRVQGIRRLFEMVKNDSRLDATALQTVGAKGHDGFLLAVVNP